MAPLREVRFVKGHGTGNDFVIIPDLDGRLDLTDDDVRFLCDRRFGIGADGVLRVVRTEHVLPADDPMRAADFFMDYRNADGSFAEMCGNGARVFVRYLDATGLFTDEECVFATRGGLRTATMNRDLSVTIDMGPAGLEQPTEVPHVRVGVHVWDAVPIHLPNPHAVVFVEDVAQAGDLHQAPVVEPPTAFPDGVNVEFVVQHEPGHIEMRVYERGVGETLSCGTGACAAAWASMHRDEAASARSVVVDVPGGTVTVAETAEGHLLLTGPADLVARGTVLLP